MSTILVLKKSALLALLLVICNLIAVEAKLAEEINEEEKSFVYINN